MAGFGYGGELSDIKYGLEISVEAPDGTDTTTPVEQGDLFKLGGTESIGGSRYKVVPLVDGDDFTNCVMVRAKHRIAFVGDLGVKVLGKWSKVLKLRYVTGVAPTLGQSIEASGVNVRRIKGKAFDGDGFVLKVNASDLEVEVLC